MRPPGQPAGPAGARSRAAPRCRGPARGQRPWWRGDPRAASRPAPVRRRRPVRQDTTGAGGGFTASCRAR
ncbi:hypothetical protein E4U92_27945 [Streptomyces galbus]|uniref:Uncharacterized protein n=1 Tax=Streptomyces galbus TaxID=33898 RepID=A0A4U5WVA4_STRGB|nr:hypothetical protein E4U92_27945 [Streptomyces galbus]